ncbi:pyridoxamine 5'-phosphate oxidase family protein [Clostridium saudiense]|nr:pyridoxamine 5'-phosphate oxidase family protein [Clostridium saudiense]
MFREMRKKSREIFANDIVDILNTAEYGILATVDAHGIPYATPLSYVYFDNAIYVHSAPYGHKLDNIANNSKVSFCVVTDTEIVPEKFTTKYKSVIVFGTASWVIGTIKNAALMEFIKKYSPQYLEKGKDYVEKAKSATTVIKIEIEHLTGKASNK